MGFLFILFLILVLSLRRYVLRRMKTGPYDPSPFPYLKIAKIIDKKIGDNVVLSWKENNVSQEHMIENKYLFEKINIGQSVTILISPKVEEESDITVVSNQIPKEPNQYYH